MGIALALYLCVEALKTYDRRIGETAVGWLPAFTVAWTTMRRNYSCASDLFQCHNFKEQGICLGDVVNCLKHTKRHA